jgi:hypothetical protein
MERPEGMDLDQAKIQEAAEYAAGCLANYGHARVRLAPGDMTEYPILIASPGGEWGYVGDGYGRVLGRDYWVALCSSFGTGYFWRGTPDVSPGYAAEKWTTLYLADASRIWTGWVISDFLNAVSEAMGGNGQERPSAESLAAKQAQDVFWAEHPEAQ